MFYPSAESSTMGLGLSLRGRRFFLVCFSFAFCEVRDTENGRESWTEVKRKNDRGKGEGGGGNRQKKQPPLNPWNLLSMSSFSCLTPPSFSHLTSLQLFEQLYLILNQTQTINTAKKVRKKGKEKERRRGEERRKLSSTQAMSLYEVLTATVTNRLLI